MLALDIVWVQTHGMALVRNRMGTALDPGRTFERLPMWSVSLEFEMVT